MAHDIEEYLKELKAHIEKVCEEHSMPVQEIDPLATSEAAVRALYPQAREVNVVAFIDDDLVLHAMTWARMPPEPAHIYITYVPHDG